MCITTNSDTFHYPAQKDLTQAVICIMKTVNVMPFIRCYYRAIDVMFYILHVAITCGDPGTPTNGQRSLSSTTYNSVVTYTCDVGYTLQGANSRTCQSDGQWSGTVPQCTCKLLKFMELSMFPLICAVVIVLPSTELQLPALAPVRMVVLVQQLTPALVPQDGEECYVKLVGSL